MTAWTPTKDLLSGLIFIGIGIAFGYASLSYELGTALNMGPSYFPLMLSGIIALLGCIIAIQSLVVGAGREEVVPVPWLGLGMVLGGVVFFGLTVGGLGVAPALFVAVFLNAFASKRTSFVSALVTAAAIDLLCVAIFVWALGIPLPVLGPWLSF